MYNEFVCVGYKCNKQGDVTESVICPVIEGVNKQGIPYGFIKTEQRFSVSDALSIGERRKFNFTSVN